MALNSRVQQMRVADAEPRRAAGDSTTDPTASAEPSRGEPRPTIESFHIRYKNNVIRILKIK